MEGLESAKKNSLFNTSYTLGLNLTPATISEFLSQWSEAMKALANWKKRRGTSCESVMFTITAMSKFHPQIKEHLYDLYREDTESRSILLSLQVNVAIVTEKGKLVEKLEFGPQR